MPAASQAHILDLEGAAIGHGIDPRDAEGFTRGLGCLG